MSNQTGAHVNVSSYKKEEHDAATGGVRVVGRVQNNSVSYEDTNFASGDSPAVLAVNTDLGRNGYKGYFINDGPGDIQVEISNDGTIYGGTHTVRGGEQLALDDLNIAKIRLTFVDPTEYRCLVTG